MLPLPTKCVLSIHEAFISFRSIFYFDLKLKAADPAPFAEQARVTVRINFTGTLNLCNALFPLLRPHARVVNVSSRAGMLKIVKDENLRKKFTSENATVEDIVKLLDDFVQ